MAFAAPPQFAHGDQVTAANMNKIADNLDAAYAKLGDAARQYATFTDREHGPYAANREESGLYFFHRFRYLAFRGTGVIEDPAGIEDDVALQDEDQFTFYDLDTVSWMTYGVHYRVSGTTFALEVEFADA